MMTCGDVLDALHAVRPLMGPIDGSTVIGRSVVAYDDPPWTSDVRHAQIVIVKTSTGRIRWTTVPTTSPVTVGHVFPTWGSLEKAGIHDFIVANLDQPVPLIGSLWRD